MELELERQSRYNAYMLNKKYRKKTKQKRNGVLRRKRDNIRYIELEADIHRYMRGAYDEDDYATR